MGPTAPADPGSPATGPPAAAKAEQELPRSTGGPGSFGECAVAALAYALLALALLRPSPADLTGSLTPDLGDPVFNLWVLDEMAEEWIDGPPFDFDAPIFHPAPRALTFSDYLPGPSLVAALVQLAGGGPITGYNLLLFGSFFLTGASTFFVLRRTGLSRAASFAGGAVFAFSPYRWDQLSHLQMLFAGFVPLVLWFWDRTLTTGRLRHAAAFLATYLLHVSGGSYLAVMIHLPLAVLALNRLPRRSGLVGRWRAGGMAGRGATRRVAVVAVAVLLAAAAFLLVYSPYLATGDRFDIERPISTMVEWGGTLLSFVTPPSRGLYGELGDAFRRPENSLFPGFASVLLAGWGLIALYRRRGGGPETKESLSRGRRWTFALLAAVAVGALAAADLHTLAGDGVTRTRHEILTGWREPFYIFLGSLLLAAGLWRRWTGRWPFARLPDLPQRTVPETVPDGARRTAREAAQATTSEENRRVWAAGLVLTGAATALLSLAAFYTLLLHDLPGFGSMRVPPRFHAFTSFTIAFLTACGVEALLARLDRERSTAGSRIRPAAALLSAALALGLAADLIPRNTDWEVLPDAADLPPVYAWLVENETVDALLELPMGDPTRELRYMYFQTLHGMPLANGYSGFFPASYRALDQSCCWAAPNAATTAELRRMGVSHVVIHLPPRWGRARRRAANSYVEQEGVELVWASPHARAFRIAEPRPGSGPGSEPGPGRGD